MSTTTQSTVKTTPTRTQPITAIPFTRLLHVELRKQLDTRAGRWLLITLGLITAIVMVIQVWVSDPEYLTFMDLALGAATPQMFLLPAIGIMAATSEWSQRTGMVTFTLEPRRGRVIAAKLISALGFGVAAVFAAIVLAAVANVAGMALQDGAGTWTVEWDLLAGFFLMQLLVVAQGVAFGMILLNTPAALVAYYVLPTVLTLLGALISWMRTPVQWLDMNSTTGPLLMGSMDGDAWAKLAVSSLVWVILPLAAGTWRVLHREVK
ncbi:ABC transporter permease [Sanguibacter sp. 25GB23B1]|uniref:ABC transporter permease n=1 Tax=unclassified Sanguibacter TaxID=2645534 RepID=UPI0032AEB6BD